MENSEFGLGNSEFGLENSELGLQNLYKLSAYLRDGAKSNKAFHSKELNWRKNGLEGESGLVFYALYNTLTNFPTEVHKWVTAKLNH